MNRSAQWRITTGAVYAAAIALLFGRPLAQLFGYALRSDMNSYVVLVPLLCAYFLWIRRSTLAKRSQSAFWRTLGIAAAGTIVWMMAMAFRPSQWMPADSDQLTLSTLAFVLLVWAGGFFFLGRDWMRSAAFPMAFLIFMVPLPSAMVGTLENASKLASAEAANMLFAITGTPTMRDGNVFQLPGITIEVAQECSGIRSSYVLVLTSLVAGNLFLTRTWARILLVCFVIPLGILRNAFRVWCIATLCINIGPQMIHSIIHRKGGPVFFTLSLIPLLLLVWWLRLRERKKHIAVREQLSGPRSTPVIPTAATSSLRENARNV
jgi:exosortase C (VPDSG-CTERM-specific)